MAYPFLKSRLRASFFSLAFVDKDVIGDTVPGIVNAYEEQQQRRTSNSKQDFARVRGNANADSTSIARATNYVVRVC